MNKQIIIWNDVIHKTVSRHRSNRNPVCSTEELKGILKTISGSIEATIYCRREGTIAIGNQFIEKKIPIVDVKKKLLSHRNQKDLKILQDLAQVHPPLEIEVRLLKTAWRKRNIIAQDVPTNRQKNKPSKRERRKKQTKQEQQKVSYFLLLFCSVLSLSLLLSWPSLFSRG